MPTTDTLLLRPEHLAELRRLLRLHLPTAEVWAYGSRVNGQAHDGSDLDLVARQPLTPEQPLPGLAVLRAALSESRLPMLVDVHDWAELPAEFRREIERQHRVL